MKNNKTHIFYNYKNYSDYKTHNYLKNNKIVMIISKIIQIVLKFIHVKNKSIYLWSNIKEIIGLRKHKTKCNGWHFQKRIKKQIDGEQYDTFVNFVHTRLDFIANTIYTDTFSENTIKQNSLNVISVPRNSKQSGQKDSTLNGIIFPNINKRWLMNLKTVYRK